MPDASQNPPDITGPGASEEYEETEPRSQGGPRSDIRNLEFCKTRPWPDHDLSRPFQALYLYPHEYDETCFLEDNFAVSKIRGPKVGQGQLRLRNSHNTQAKKKHFCRYFGVELKCRELFSFKNVDAGFLAVSAGDWRNTFSIGWFHHFPCCVIAFFLSTQPAPDADSLGIGFNDSSTDSFVRTVELGNLRAVQGGSVHLVMERLRAGGLAPCFFYCSSFAHHLLIMASCDGLMVFDSVWSRLHIIWYELLWFDGLSCQTFADYMHIRCRFSCSSVAPVLTLRDTGELHHVAPLCHGDDIKWYKVNMRYYININIMLISCIIYIYIWYDMTLVTGSDMKQCKISLINRKWSCRWFLSATVFTEFDCHSELVQSCSFIAILKLFLSI